MAAIQYFFRNNDDAHSYCSSLRNQRIEGFLSSLRRSQTTWWMNFLKDLAHQKNLNTDNGFQQDCLWFCFAELIQNDLDKTLERWNTHKIRKSRNDTISERANALYFLPQKHGGKGLGLFEQLLQICGCWVNFLMVTTSGKILEPIAWALPLQIWGCNTEVLHPHTGVTFKFKELDVSLSCNSKQYHYYCCSSK